MYSGKIVASSNNIPTTFGTGAGSLILTAPSAGNVEIINRTLSVLAVAITGDHNVPASTPYVNYIPPAPEGGSAGWVHDRFKVKIGDRIFIRSDTGSTVTSGTVYCNLW